MIGEKIKLLRRESNLTQQELAQKLNVAQGAVAMWETGKRTPDLEMIKKISSFFKVSTDYLTGGSKYKNFKEEKDYSWGIGDPYFDAAFNFAKLLEPIRDAKDISLVELGRVIGVGGEMMEDIEEGFVPITCDTAEKLCSYLGTNVSQVLFNNNLYDEIVPEEYRDNVREWEKFQESAEIEAGNTARQILNPDIRMIARAGQKMTPEQAENLRKYAQFMFPEAFKDVD